MSKPGVCCYAAYVLTYSYETFIRKCEGLVGQLLTGFIILISLINNQNVNLFKWRLRLSCVMKSHNFVNEYTCAPLDNVSGAADLLHHSLWPEFGQRIALWVERILHFAWYTQVQVTMRSAWISLVSLSYNNPRLNIKLGIWFFLNPHNPGDTSLRLKFCSGVASR